MKVEISRNWRIKPRIVIHDHDTWSMDNTLARIILPMLKNVKACKVGTPGILFPDDHHEQPDQDKLYEETREKWEDILDKMIFSMEQIAYSKNGPDMPIPILQKKMSRKQRSDRWWKSVPLYSKDGKKVGDIQRHNDQCDPAEDAKWRKDHSEYLARVQEGCELFGKYFQNLWT